MWTVINNYPNYSVSTDGEIKNNLTDRVLKKHIRNGYYAICLSNNNIKKTFNIHNIVANTYLDRNIIDDKLVVNHINENKLDNRLSNLEFVTYSYNTKFSSNSARTKNQESFVLDEFTNIPDFDNYMISKNGLVYSKFTKGLMKHQVLPNGYCKIKLKNNDNIYRDKYIHVLIATTYLDYKNNDNNLVINHYNGNKSNNTIDNLEIVTKSENMLHSIDILKNPIFKQKVYYINNNQAIIFESVRQASLATNIDSSLIVKCCKNKIKHAKNIKWYYYNPENLTSKL